MFPQENRRRSFFCRPALQQRRAVFFCRGNTTFASFVRAIAFRLMLLSSSRRLLPALLLWLALPCAGFAQTAQFESLTIEQGLSQGMIFDILQTRDGFLWVATKDGLNRYDGYNFKIFTHNPFTPYTLAENTSVALFEDSRGLLWVATESKGVDVYDHRSGRFHHFPRLQAMAFSEGGDGDLWAVTKGELVRLAIPDGWGNMPLPENPDLTALVSVQKVRIEGYAGLPERLISIWPKEDGNFVLFSSAKHYEVSSAQNAARPLPGPLFGRVPQGAYQNGGHVWIVGDLFSVHHLYRGETTRYVALSSVYSGTSNFHKDGQGRFWFSAKGSLWQLEPGEPLDPSKPDYVLDQDVTCLRSDRNGNLWVGTLGYGLRKINPKRKAFHTAAPNKSAWRLWKSPQGVYYWRDFVEIYTYDPVTGAHNIPAFPDLHEAKLDMSFDEDGTIWLLSALRKSSIETLGAYGADGRLKQQYRFDINASDYSLLNRTRDGNFWITEAGASLSCFDTRSNQIRRFDYSHLFGEKAALVQSFAFAQDGNGDFWIGTQQGLVKCGMGLGNPQFQLMQTDPGNPQGLNHNVIACLLPDPVKPGEVLWIGTKGGGINRLDIRSGQVRHFTTEDGLPDMVVYGILPGNERPPQGRPSFWCSTNRGLAKLVFPETLKTDEKPAITVFSATKGLQDSEFNTQAFFKAHDGELLFGGISGFNHFLPEAVLPDTARPPVFVVGISINHEAVNLRQRGLKTSLDCLRELQLGYDENNVSFEFAALDFTDPAQNRYRYRLVGADDDWVATKGTRFAHFAHLAPGRYEFRVQGSNGEGGWREASNPIVVVVHPPWYRSNWAYLCYALLLAWGAWRGYRFQIQRVKEREQLAFEHREKERIKAVEHMKTNFFSNITHEFRTPLTLMTDPLRLILQKAKDPEVLENARLAAASSQQLLGLVNQLLDMSKIESGQMALDLRSGDLTETVRDVFERFLPLAEKRGVKLTFQSEGSTTFGTQTNVVFDENKIKLILNNLISNAIKFTPAHGKIAVLLNFATTTSPYQILLQVKDTGVGIPPEALNKIFDRFYQIDGTSTRMGEGTGIGLALAKELAELMGGGIAVDSEVGKGSTFTVRIPVGFTIDDLRLTISASGPEVVAPNSEIRNPKSEIRNRTVRNQKSEIDSFGH